MTTLRPWASALALAALAGCAGISQSGTWRDPQFSGPAFRKVLVVVASDAQTNRRILEDTFANTLQQWGVGSAVSYPAGDSVPPDDAARIVVIPSVQGSARTAAADGIVTIRLLRVDRAYYNSGPSVGVGVGGGSGGWGGGWSGGGIGVSFPVGGSSSSGVDTLTVEAALTSRANNRLVWSATYSMNDPGNTAAGAETLSTQIVTDMRKAGVI
ncbi:MAG: hypothetical protein QM803_14130 [Rhodocyclaceae bacterium]